MSDFSAERRRYPRIKAKIPVELICSGSPPMRTTIDQLKSPANLRKRGNPNWGNPPEVKPASALTEFELRARSLRLQERSTRNRSGSLGYFQLYQK